MSEKTIQIVLEGDVHLVDNLTYKEACEALNKANELAAKHPALKNYVFHIKGAVIGGWSLLMTDQKVARAFVGDSQGFVIEIEKEEKEKKDLDFRP